MLIGEIRERLGGDYLPAIYRAKIRSQRTRSCLIAVPARENPVEIMHTLLGIELRVGRRRFSSPDLATARYMLVFARLGCAAFAIPYDITQVSAAADELETSWQKALLLAAADCLSIATAKRHRGVLIGEIRREIESIGPGEAVPHFKQSTRQRRA